MKKQKFASGAVREASGSRTRPDLISPFFLARLGNRLSLGAVKYESWNWAKGINQSRCFESLMRHLIQYASGDTTEDHLAAVGCNLMMMIHNEETVNKVAFVPKDHMLDLPLFEPMDDVQK